MTSSLRSSIDALIIGLTTCAALTACSTVIVPASLYESSREIGNTYMFDKSQGVYACATALLDGCFKREAGNFTIDNAARVLELKTTVVHLVFEDGQLGWMAYNDFLLRKFNAPVQTRLQIRLGAPADQIRAQLGNPDTIEPNQAGRVTLEVWTYGALGKIYIEDGKVAELALKKSLLAK